MYLCCPEVDDFPRRNWLLVMLLQPLIAVSYFTVIPTIHQFITNPRGGNDTENFDLCMEEVMFGKVKAHNNYKPTWLRSITLV